MAEKAPELPRSRRVYKERCAIARATYADAEADPRTNRSSSPVTGDSAWAANCQVFVGASPRKLLLGCPVPLRSWRSPPWLGVGKDALATCGRLWEELLDRKIFFTLQEAHVLIERWRQHYNGIRPHSALGYRPPAPETRSGPRLALPPLSQLELAGIRN